MFDNIRSSTSVETHAVVIVVSPLVAIMKSEMTQMPERNERAAYVGDIGSETEDEVCGRRYIQTHTTGRSTTEQRPNVRINAHNHLHQQLLHNYDD